MKITYDSHTRRWDESVPLSEQRVRWRLPQAEFSAERGELSTPELGRLADGTYEVDFLVARRRFRGKNKYRVRWKGYDTSEDTWEQEKNVEESLIKQFVRALRKVQAQRTGVLKKRGRPRVVRRPHIDTLEDDPPALAKRRLEDARASSSRTSSRSASSRS